MVLFLESGSIKYLKQPTLDHMHPTFTTPLPPTSNLCGLCNSIKCQLPFYPGIKWTNMFSLPLLVKFPTADAPIQGVDSFQALPVTTPQSWPSNTTASLLLVPLPNLSSDLTAWPDQLGFASVWSDRVGTEISSDFCDFLLGFLSQLGKRVRSSQQTFLKKKKRSSWKKQRVATKLWKIKSLS